MQIEFNGQLYKKDTLASLIGFGHKESVDTKSIHVVENSHCESKHPIAYKHDGKLFVLAGTINSGADKTDVVIISKHILKKGLMTVQSQPMDTRVDFTHVNKWDNRDRDSRPDSHQPTQRIPDSKARAALDILGGSGRSTKKIEKDTRTTRALQILENTMNREKRF